MDQNVLDLPDDAFSEMSFPQSDVPAEPVSDSDAGDVVSDDYETHQEPEADEPEYDDAEPEDTEEADESSDEPETVDESEELDESEAEDDDPTESGDETSEQADTDGVDYKSEYERLLAPFRANGKDMQVRSVDEAITLMQQGANYNKKMAALKPNLKLMKMLDNNSVLSEEKLSFLIDLDKGNPDAIRKLVKDKGVDTYELDNEDGSEYKAGTYTVDDAEMELDSVLDEIKGTDTYERTLDVVSNKWDVASRKTIAQHPQLLTVINEHITTGIYDQVIAEVDRERSLGKWSGVPDIEAYRQVGDRLNAEGKFNPESPAEEKESPPPKTKRATSPEVTKRKRAASPTRSTKSPASNPSFNPLSLSDEEFEKQFSERFM